MLQGEGYRHVVGAGDTWQDVVTCGRGSWHMAGCGLMWLGVGACDEGKGHMAGGGVVTCCKGWGHVAGYGGHVTVGGGITEGLWAYGRGICQNVKK